jgi:hypothetical protein
MSDIAIPQQQLHARAQTILALKNDDLAVKCREAGKNSDIPSAGRMANAAFVPMI